MIIKVTYVKKNSAERQKAKGYIRYIQHRKGRDGQKTSRTLFTSDGRMEREQAYRLIDTAQPGCTFFRVVISPAMDTEDTRRDLSLDEITRNVLADLSERLGSPVAFVAAVHQDHTTHRHVHALVIARQRLLPVQAMKQKAGEEALAQRRELDRIREHHQQEQAGEEAPWE